MNLKIEVITLTKKIAQQLKVVHPGYSPDWPYLASVVKSFETIGWIAENAIQKYSSPMVLIKVENNYYLLATQVKDYVDYMERNMVNVGIPEQIFIK